MGVKIPAMTIARYLPTATLSESMIFHVTVVTATAITISEEVKYSCCSKRSYPEEMYLESWDNRAHPLLAK